jgi:AraC family transcriptional regulator of adaptative response/methylated-DNA-[protein]-cysteine methyltransferase
VAQACRLLEQDAPLTLEALARQLAVSPFHFHRLFKSVTGMTPKAWQQAWRARRLREALEQGIPVTRAALAAGFPDSSSYYRQADAALGMTASQFRRGGAATVVTWTTGDCALGRCLVAQSERGVCAVLPGDNDAALLDDLRQRFPNAELREGDPEFRRRWPRFSPTSTTAGGRYRCRWICGAPRFSCRSGRRCGRSRRARPAATARWQSILASRGR